MIALVTLAILDPGFLGVTAGLLSGLQPGLARTVLSMVNAVASLAVVGVLLAIVVDAIRSRRFAVTAAALSCSLAVLSGFAVGLLVDLTAGAAAVTRLTGPPSVSPGLPVTAAIAMVVGADLQRGRLRGAARPALAVAIACAVILGSLTVPSAAYAVLMGATVGLGVRVAVGVVPARPSADLVRSVVARAGWPVTALQLLKEAPGRVRYAGVHPGGDAMRITVVDEDGRGVPLARRAWRLLRLRTAAVGRPALSLRGQLERQALSAALANSAGVATPRALALLSAGPALMLVEQPLVGTPLSAAAASEAAAGAAAAARALRQLHDAGLAHGALTVDGIVLLPDGRAGFAELLAAQPAATDLQRELDVVAILVATSTRIGAAAAVTALRSGYRSTPATEARLAALLQPLALTHSARRAARGTTILNDLRAALTGPGTDGATAAPPRLERLRTRTVISVVGGTAAAYVLATQLSKVSIAEALRPAHPGWLAVALLASALTYLGSALAKQAFQPIALPLARTALVQLASSFLALVTPPSVGHVGLNIRYLQRAGVPTAVAAASVAVSEAVTVTVTVLLLLACGWLSGASASQLSLLPSGTVLTVMLVTAGALALVAAAPPSRRLIRRRLEPLLRRTLPQLLATASDPRRLGTAIAGILVLNGGYVLALDASMRAYSASLALPVLVVVYLASSAIGSAAPTPGGLGAVEAALVGGLTATGVPIAAALTAVLAFRAVTFWLPAPVGWGAFVALQRRGWV